MILAVDAGNSRTKWGVFDADGTLLAAGAVDNDALERLAEVWHGFSGCRRAVVSSVAGEAVAARLGGLFELLALPALWIRAPAAACGVKNGYAQPEQLGADRWAALVGAWNRYRAPCVVATAGTALTVDALSGEGEFLGGLIVPGFSMMRAALAAGTAGVPAAPGQWRDFPVATADAVYSGALAAMAGAVQRMRALLEAREGHAPQCLLAGGDAELLAAALPGPTIIAHDLVLQGLFLMEKALS